MSRTARSPGAAATPRRRPAATRLGPPGVGRAVAGPRRRGARDARRRPRAIYGVGASSAFDYATLEVDGRAAHGPGAPSRRPLGGGRGDEPVRARRPTPLVAAPRDAADGRAAHGRRRACPDTLARHASTSATPILVWQVGDRRFLVDATDSLFARRRPTEPPRRRGGAAGRRRPAGGVGRRSASARRSTRSTSTRRPASPRSTPADVGSAAPSRWASASPTRTASSSRRGPTGWSRSSASTRRACGRPS